MSLIKAIKEQNHFEIKNLLEQGANLYEVDEEGNSAFLLAIKHGFDLELIKLFVDKGVDPMALSDQGVGAIDIAIEAQRLDVVKWLHSLGLDLNDSKRVSKMTPLMVAACYNRVEIAKYLIMNDVDETKTDCNGLSALDYARKLGQTAMVDFLKSI